jgi:hypothetical protein
MTASFRTGWVDFRRWVRIVPPGELLVLIVEEGLGSCKPMKPVAPVSRILGWEDIFYE